MKLLGSYLKRQRKLCWMLAAFAAIFGAVFALYDLPLEAVLYAALLCLAVGGVLFGVGFTAYARRHRELERIRQNIRETVFSLPESADLLEEDYQRLLQAVSADRAAIAASLDAQRQEMLDYYTLWAHQIKTPIAAMGLLLTQTPPDTDALSAELVKTEEYVEMVLTYLRLGSDTTDFVLRSCPLDDIVRGALRKLARLFIIRHITLDFSETGKTVVTDEKWLGFVIGQLLSNALKYTPEGGAIRIYGDGRTLAISDSGIGIRAEDLPRVFEKGFTGYNGREEKKSTGLGLYLCRGICGKLGHELTITSRPGSGTLVRLYFPDSALTAE